MIFAIVSVISYIVGAVFTAVSILIAVVMKAIAVIVLAAKALITAAVKFTIGVVKASFGWMKAVGSKLITAVKAGWSQGLSSMTGVKGSTVALGAATNAAWSGIQTARHGGSWKDIFRSAVKGAVIGAIGAVTGAFMHGFGAGAGSLGGGGTSLTGTAMHAAAHGVSGGAMSAANGGSFKDGFIGGAIGFGVGLPFGGTGGMIQGIGPGAIAARTAIAAIGGGVGSKLAGGSFADGAYSAAFNHLFNNELENIQNGLRRSWEGAKAAFSHFGREFPNAAAALPGQLSQGMGQLMENDAIAATMVVSHAPMVVGGAIAAAPGMLANASAILSGGAITTEALTGVSATGGVSAYAGYRGVKTLLTGASSLYDDATRAGSRYVNIATDVNAADFQANLVASGYNVVKSTMGKNGPVSVLSNGAKTYSVYTRTSNGASGAQLTDGAGNILVKFNLR